MIFLFILVFGVLFLFLNVRQVAPGNKGSIIAGLTVVLLPVSFVFRGHLWASVIQAFMAVWLCQALLLYMLWWVARGVRRAVVRKPLKQRFSILTARVLLAVSVVVTAVMCFVGYAHNADYKIREASVDLPGENFTALFFSDLHIDPLFDRHKIERMTADAARIKPDYILFGGDFADVMDSVLTEQGYDSLIQQFAKTAGVAAIAINGNHEAYMERSGSDPNGWLRKNGFIVLDDSTACMPHACFTGCTDFQVARIRELSRVPLQMLAPKENALPWIVLDHQPKGIEKEHTGRLPDFALSGHTHNGQFFPGTIVIKWVWRLVYGLGELDGVKWLVSSGIDCWGPPVRVGSDTEMWLIRF